MLACKSTQSDACIAPEKIAAIKKAFAGPKNSYGTQVYPGFLYDAGIANTSGLPGLLALGNGGIFGRYPDATEIDVDKEALHASDPLVEPASTNLSTFSAGGGKLLFFHGDSDPWFSPLDTLGYYQSLAETNGGAEKVAEFSRMFLVPGMMHCGGGPALDRFDMVSAVVNWVEKGTGPESVIATGQAFPGRSRPLCAYPKHAQYSGHGDTNDAQNFSCQRRRPVASARRASEGFLKLQDRSPPPALRPRDLVMIPCEMRAWTPARQPVWRPALQSVHYTITRSRSKPSAATRSFHHGSSEITVTDFDSTVSVSLPPFTLAETGLGTTVLGFSNVFTLST